jgi:cobalt-zinc-cadmium efflux system outer membrane protein
MRTVVLCAALLTAAVPSRAGAQPLSLTESEALARLSPDGARVRAIRASIDVSRADVLAAGRWPNPRVTANRESVAGVRELITTVSQPLPVTGRRRFEILASSALLEASSTRADDAIRRARADLRAAFAGLVEAQVRERELTAAHGRLRALADLLSTREAAGDASGFDRLRAEREVLDIDADRATAATDRVRLQAAVASFFTEPVDSSRIVAIEGAAPEVALPSVEALIERASSARGELIALRKEIDAARMAARAADRRRVPEPEIVAGTKSSTVGGVGSVVAVQAVVPLFDRGRAERTVAEARARQAAGRLEVLQSEVRSEISALRAAVLERRETARRYRTPVVKGAGEIERIAEVSYNEGERGILELLDAYRTGAAARIRQAALDLAVRIAEIELEFVSGWEIL